MDSRPLKVLNVNTLKLIEILNAYRCSLGVLTRSIHRCSGHGVGAGRKPGLEPGSDESRHLTRSFTGQVSQSVEVPVACELKIVEPSLELPELALGRQGQHRPEATCEASEHDGDATAVLFTPGAFQAAADALSTFKYPSLLSKPHAKLRRLELDGSITIYDTSAPHDFAADQGVI